MLPACRFVAMRAAWATPRSDDGNCRRPRVGSQASPHGLFPHARPAIVADYVIHININTYLSPFWVKFSASALPPWQATLPQWRLARIDSSTLALGRVSLLLAVGRPWCPHVRRTSLGGVRDTDLERVRSASFVTPTHAAWTLSLAIARRRSVPVPAGSQAPPGRIGN